MAKAVFEQFVGDPDVAVGGGVGVKAIFCVAGVPGVLQGEVFTSFEIGLLDTVIDIKHKLSNGIRDAVFSLHGVTLTNNDILVPDLTKGSIL